MFRNSKKKVEVDIELENLVSTNLVNKGKNQIEPPNHESQYILATQESLHRAEQERIDAETKAKLAILKTDSDVQIETIKANAKILVAQKEAQALEIKSRSEAQAKKIVGAVEIEVLKKKMQVELEYLKIISDMLQKNPALLQIELARINSESKNANPKFPQEKFISGYGKPGSSTLFQRPDLVTIAKSHLINNDSQPDVILHTTPSPTRRHT